MRSLRRSGRWAFALALIVLAVIAPGLARDVSEASGSGCSREEGRKATSDSCAPAPGHVCYYCEYAPSGGGYSICYENATGTIKYCTDYQTLPTD